jgi:GcrA cell cycle regulator
MTSAPWTDARVETLKSLWLDGLSATQVAAALGGVTRNAVIGKLHRLGVAGRGAPAAPRTIRSSRPPAVRASRQLTPARGRRADARPATGVAHTSAVVVKLAPLVHDLVAVAPSACRWPIGDPRSQGFGFCGRPRTRGAYCADHGACAYRGAGEPLDRDPFVERLAGRGR